MIFSIFLPKSTIQLCQSLIGHVWRGVKHHNIHSNVAAHYQGVIFQLDNSNFARYLIFFKQKMHFHVETLSRSTNYFTFHEIASTFQKLD